jgi:UDP-N-acetylglucosamine transferase subunit ALG13
MIFVTVGSMFPFDRIVRAMDHWASRHPEEHALAQIGAGEYEPRHMDWVRKTPTSEFRTNVEAASIVVAHAGMGTIITAAEFGRPIVLLPRRVALGEHTTDHQFDTANRLKDKSGIFVSASEEDLDCTITQACSSVVQSQWCVSKSAPESMTERIRQFINSGGIEALRTDSFEKRIFKRIRDAQR